MYKIKGNMFCTYLYLRLNILLGSYKTPVIGFDWISLSKSLSRVLRGRCKRLQLSAGSIRRVATILKKQRQKKVKYTRNRSRLRAAYSCWLGGELTVLKLIEHYIFSIRSSIHSSDPIPNSRQTQGRFS